MILIKVVLIAVSIIYIYMIRNKFKLKTWLEFDKKLKYSIVGLITNFFDFLGIGSFTSQTLILENDHQYRDDVYLIPGTMSVGNFLPTIVQAFIIINVVDVDLMTITILPISAAFGSYIGSKYIKKENNDLIKLVLAIALSVTAVLLFMNAFNIPPFNNMETSLTGLSGNPTLLIIAAVIFFVLGILQSFGLGIYAPGFAILGLMGVSYIYIMPINMMSTIILSIANSIEFISQDKFIKPVSISITLFGVIGVCLAATFSYIIDFNKIVGPLQVIIAFIALLTVFKMLHGIKSR